MDIRELLEYQIFKIGEYSLSVYSLVMIAIIYALAFWVNRLTGKLLNRMAKRRGLDPGRQHSFHLLLRYFVWITAISAMFGALGIQLNWLLASSAALLVGLGLGLQQVFSDIVAGIILLFEGTIEKGDIIEVDGVVGRIEEIHLRTTKFRNRDDQMMIIPNHKFIKDNVVNWSYDNHIARFTVKVGVSYNSDLDQVRQILLDCAAQNPDVVINNNEKSPRVRLDEFADSSVNFSLQFYSGNMFRIETSKSDIRFAIWDAFKKHDVQIPFPQRDIHIKTEKIPA